MRANNDFDDKSNAFGMKNIFWTKIPKNGHCGCEEHCSTNLSVEDKGQLGVDFCTKISSM